MEFGKGEHVKKKKKRGNIGNTIKKKKRGKYKIGKLEKRKMET